MALSYEASFFNRLAFFTTLCSRKDMTSADIRQSFLDFFQQKKHTIVPSASLLPQSPGLLFTNAGMNQFVPYFLGTENPPYSPARSTDTQKCIRAGGKHNDLEDVGYDTYHHTFFEMLGNWSFGDYFKTEAITWAWELITEVWKFPADRLYATVYAPSEGDPSSFDKEAYDIWADLFKKSGLDPEHHIVNGNVKDNFWMMGETGPCGPCSELHMDISPDKSGRALVNQDSDQCIEIWNLVFIQYNAEADGSFRDLPAKHIDTGMGFERICSILQNTNGLTDFTQRISNYATDVFSPIFKKLEELSSKTYVDIYPHDPGAKEQGEILEQAIAFRVIADHVRTLSLSIADGIQPGSNGRNYVLRRILRRAVRYGRALGFGGNTLFLSQLVDDLASQLVVFPELQAKSKVIKETLDREERSFNAKLDRGLTLFNEVQSKLKGSKSFPAEQAFKLYDTYGFPIDLTALLCREYDLTLDEIEVERHMEAQRNRARAAQKSQVVRALDISTTAKTSFNGFDTTTSSAKVVELIKREEGVYVISDVTPFYVEKGGQVADTGTLNGHPIQAVIQAGDAVAHLVEESVEITVGDEVELIVDAERRHAISSHHSATHLLNWALREHISEEISQQGSLVSEERLRFDFNSSALKPDQVIALEQAVNEKISENTSVSWIEVKHAGIKDRADITQFFGDKYGEVVRVVQIGGEPTALNGYSMELCGGTHVKATQDIGQFIIKREEAVASGVRRIEAVCGEAATAYIREQSELLNVEIAAAHEKLTAANAVLSSLELPVIQSPQQSDTSLSGLKKSLDLSKKAASNADKAVKKAMASQAAKIADDLLSEELKPEENNVFSLRGDASLLTELINGLKKRDFSHAAFIILQDGNKLQLAAYSGEQSQSKGLMAGKLIQNLAPIAGGRGGGKPDQARGAASEVAKVEELQQAAQKALSC